MIILLYCALVSLTVAARIRALVRVTRQNCFEIKDNASDTLSNKLFLLSYCYDLPFMSGYFSLHRNSERQSSPLNNCYTSIFSYLSYKSGFGIMYSSAIFM